MPRKGARCAACRKEHRSETECTSGACAATDRPRKKEATCAACRKVHWSEAECASGVCAASAARAEPCQACRRARRPAAECEQRHPADFAAAQAGAKVSEECRGRTKGTDGAGRSGDGSMAFPNKEMEKDASEECTSMPQQQGISRCAACRQAHRSEEQCAQGACAARSERCEACRTEDRSAAECAVRHPQVFAAAQSSRGREAADITRSGGRAMPAQLMQTVPGSVGNHEKETGDWFPSHIDDIKTRPFDQNLTQCLLAFEFLNSFRQNFFYFPQLPTITM
jgi:hypothetical protein